MKHTPGPWKTTAAYITTDTHVVARWYSAPNTAMQWIDRDSEEARANAHLIAAAPKLLEEMESAVDLYSLIERGMFDAAEDWVRANADEARAVVAMATVQE